MSFTLVIILILSFSRTFIAVTTNYDEHESLTALYHSYGAFCDADALQNWDCKYCQYISNFSIETVIEDASNQLFAFTGYDYKTNQIVVSFRGSQVQNWKNWITDCDWYHVPIDHEDNNASWHIHRGFYRGIHDLLDAGLYDSLSTLFTRYQGSKVLLTGHSLGGALAQVLALMFHIDNMFLSMNIGPIGIITFGSPRWGSKDMVTYFNTIGYTNWRIVNQYDLIPTLPYQMAGYYHPRTQVQYTDYRALTYEICDGNGEESSNCESYNPSYSTKYHKHYLNVYEDQCGRKPECTRRRYLDANYSSCVLEDEYFEWFSPPNTTDNLYLNMSNKSNKDFMLITIVCIGCVLLFVMCGLLMYLGYRYKRKMSKKNEQNKYHQMYSI